MDCAAQKEEREKELAIYIGLAGQLSQVSFLSQSSAQMIFSSSRVQALFMKKVLLACTMCMCMRCSCSFVGLSLADEQGTFIKTMLG